MNSTRVFFLLDVLSLTVGMVMVEGVEDNEIGVPGGLPYESTQ